MDGERNQEDWKYAGKAMAWYGWGSPVGLGVLLVCAGALAVLVRFALLGN